MCVCVCVCGYVCVRYEEKEREGGRKVVLVRRCMHVRMCTSVCVIVYAYKCLHVYTSVCEYQNKSTSNRLKTLRKTYDINKKITPQKKVKIINECHVK